MPEGKFNFYCLLLTMCTLPALIYNYSSQQLRFIRLLDYNHYPLKVANNTLQLHLQLKEKNRQAANHSKNHRQCIHVATSSILTRERLVDEEQHRQKGENTSELHGLIPFLLAFRSLEISQFATYELFSWRLRVSPWDPIKLSTISLIAIDIHAQLSNVITSHEYNE